MRVVPRPNDANPNGDIFGGWLMSQVDIAGAIAAVSIAKGSVVTRAVKEFQFLESVFVGDLVSLYTEIIAVGTTSVTVKIEVFTQSHLALNQTFKRVAESIIVYVAVSEPGKKRVIPKI